MKSASDVKFTIQYPESLTKHDLKLPYQLNIQYMTKKINPGRYFFEKMSIFQKSSLKAQTVSLIQLPIWEVSRSKSTPISTICLPESM